MMKKEAELYIRYNLEDESKKLNKKNLQGL